MAIQLYAVSLDCADAKELANFWSAALERPVAQGATAEFAAIGLADAGGVRDAVDVPSGSRGQVDSPNNSELHEAPRTSCRTGLARGYDMRIS